MHYLPNNGQRLIPPMHRYEQVDATTLDYDLTGNLLTDGSNSYTYDVFNRQISMIGLDSTAEYVYDALGRRVAKIVDGVTTYYVYNAGYQVIEERNGSNQLLARYTYGAGIDEPLTMERGGQTYYFHRDALGSITEITDASGALVERYEYDVYGAAQIFDSTNTPLTASAIGNPYLFTGRRYDPESGNYYYRARMYSPTLGRFLQTDPLGYVDGLNLYTYVGNNPASWFDPWGLTVREGFADIFDPEETINVHRGARDVVGMAAGLGIIGLLDALLSEILSDDDEEDPSPSSTSEDEHEICQNNADPGTTGRPDVTDRVHDKLRELSEDLKRLVLGRNRIDGREALKEFAEKVQGKRVLDLHTPKNMTLPEEIIYRIKGADEVHFNLEGMGDLKSAFQSGKSTPLGSPNFKYTNWELYQVAEGLEGSPLENAIFYLEGGHVVKGAEIMKYIQ